MAITKADVIEAIDEVIDALAKYEQRAGRQVELNVGSDGMATLMVAEEMTPAGEPATGFEELAHFVSFEDLWTFLQMAEVA